MKTTDELVRELADREAIRDLSMRYCDCLYREDLEGLLSLFAERASYVVKGPSNEVATRGRSRLKKMFENLIREVRPRPVIHAHVIDLLDANSATGRCSVELRNATLEVERIGSGCFEDNYVRESEQWKFATRRLVESDMTTPLRAFVVN